MLRRCDAAVNGMSTSENARSEIRDSAASPRQGQHSRRLTVRIILKQKENLILSASYIFYFLFLIIYFTYGLEIFCLFEMGGVSACDG